MLKVLIYTHEYPPFRGGAGVYSFDLAHGLALMGVEVHVATTCKDLSVETSALLNSNTNVHLHYLESSQASLPSAFYFLLRLYLLHLFDVVVVTERNAQEVISKIKYPFFKYASVIHGSEVLYHFGKTPLDIASDQSRMLRLYKRSIINIAVSRATYDLAKRLIKCESVSLVTVQNGVNIGRLPAVDCSCVQKIRNQYPTNTEFVFSLGRLDLDKGHDILISAFKQVLKQRPMARLLIGGDGPYRQRLSELCYSLELNNYICFLGNISDADVPTYYGLCDVFAMPSKSESRWEGFGLVFLEANCYEKPVVGGNEGGVAEAIADGKTGYLVNPRNASGVADAIVKLLQDKPLQKDFGQRGRQRVLDYFNSDRMAKETLGVLIANLDQDKFFDRLTRYYSMLFYGITYSLFAVGTRVSKILKVLLMTNLKTRH